MIGGFRYFLKSSVELYYIQDTMGCDSSRLAQDCWSSRRENAYIQSNGNIKSKDIPGRSTSNQYYHSKLESQQEPVLQTPGQKSPLEFGAESSRLKEAETLWRRSQFQKAIKICEQIINLNNNNDEAMNQLGLCYFYLQRYEEAAEKYNQAIQKNRLNACYWFNLGKALFNLYNYPQSIEAHRKAIAIDPDKSEYHLHLAHTYYYSFQYQKGIESYRKGEELDPKNEAYSHQIGLCHYYLEDYAQAIDSFSRAIELAPTHHASMNHLGLCYYYQEDYPSAEQYFRRALQAAPRNSSYLWNLGRNYYYMEDYPRAIAAYEQCIELRPRDSSYEEEIAMCYYYMEDYDSALAWIDKAIQKNPNYPSGYQKKGLVCFEMDDYVSATLWNEKALQCDPSYFQARLSLANNYYFLKQFSQAIEWYAKCCRIDNKDQQVYFNLGKSFYFNKQYKQSIPYFEKCLKYSQAWIDPFIFKGKALFNVGRFHQCLHQFKKAKALIQECKSTNVSQYLLYIAAINNQISTTYQFLIKSKIAGIDQEEQQQAIRRRQGFENKIDKLSTFSMKQDNGKKRKSLKQKVHLSEEIIEIALYLYQNKQLGVLRNLQGLTKICDIVQRMCQKDYSFFHLLPSIFLMFARINRFQKKISILKVQQELSHKINYLCKHYFSPGKRIKLNEDIDFPAFPRKKYNLFGEKGYFQSYDEFIEAIESVNQAYKQIILSFKEFVFQIQAQSHGKRADFTSKLPSREQCIDDEEYKTIMFQSLINTFQTMFKNEVLHKKQAMLQEIESQLDNYSVISMKEVTNIMIKKWITYIDSALKIRKQHKVSTQFYSSDLVSGRCFYKDTSSIKQALCCIARVSQLQCYEIMELENRLHKSTQDVVIKIKIKHCVCELQLALDFDLTKFEFGHNFYEIERCSLGCIFGCSLFLTKEVNETFPELLFENEKAVKRARHIDEEAHKALDFVIKQLMESEIF